MTKFTVVAPIYDKWVKKSGDHIFKRGDQWIIRFSGTHKKRKYTMMWRGNHLFQAMSSYFKYIGEVSVEHWTEYKDYIGNSRSGRNPYLKNNIQIMYPDLVGTVRVDDITSPPEYPEIPSCFYAAYDTGLDGVCYSWLDTYAFETIIEAGYYNMPGRARPPKEWMKIGKGDLSGSEQIFLKGENFKAGNLSYASVRSINLRGEVSDWADPIVIDIPDRPLTDFSGAPRKGIVPLSVDFLNLTEGVVKSFLWTFGDGFSSTLVNPTHIYYGLPGDYYTVRLLAWGVADSKYKKTRYNYIGITFECDYPSLFVADSENHRFHERNPFDLIHVLTFGSFGSALGYFNYPFGVVMDKYFLYITDYVNCRIVKRLKFESVYSQEIGTEGSGEDQFQYPAGIAADSDRLYICDRYNSRVVKRKKNDLSYVLMVGTHGTGDNQFRWPTGIAVDDDHVFICDNGNHRIFKRTKLTLEYVSKIGSEGAGNDQFNDPYGIAADDDHLYIADTGNDRIVKRLKSDLSFVSKIGSHGSGDDQFDLPKGIVVCDEFLYISDSQNNRIHKRLKSDLSFVSKIGSQGSGINQFNHPIGLAVLETDPLPNIVGWWLLKTAGYDVGNTRFTDQTGNEHHAVNFGASVNSDHTVFDGNDYCEIADFKEVSGNFKRFSLAIWVNFSSDHAGTLCSHYDDLDADIQPSWWSIIQTEGKHSHRVYGDNILVLRKDYISSYPVNDSDWHLLGFTFNDNVFKIFCDSVLDPDPNKYLDHTFSTLTDSTAKFLIGARYFQSMVSDHYTGKISKLYFFNEELTQCEWNYLLRLGH